MNGRIYSLLHLDTEFDFDPVVVRTKKLRWSTQLNSREDGRAVAVEHGRRKCQSQEERLALRPVVVQEGKWEIEEEVCG